MGSALETLCGQAYGAKQYHMLGVYTQRAMLTLLCLSIPLAVVWLYTSNILIALGQDIEISTEAGIFNRWMIPSLFAYGLVQCLNRFLQTQNNVLPMMMSSLITASLHIVFCWVFIFKFELGSRGAALATVISNWNNVILLAIYVKLSPSCIKTWTGFTTEALHDIVSFAKLAVPSAVMICFEYWSFEMVVLLSGLLPNPKLGTSVLSISLNTCWMVYMISVGLGGTIRVGKRMWMAESLRLDKPRGLLCCGDSLCCIVCVWFPHWRDGFMDGDHMRTVCASHGPHHSECMYQLESGGKQSFG
ncbi:hypothetical protein BT93_B2541 [Corymbia citriodora subsp. variegata]|nr:hypothetical protein BT93_B2541 [Corymbia citriodora subsp. variegata]